MAFSLSLSLSLSLFRTPKHAHLSTLKETRTLLLFLALQWFFFAFSSFPFSSHAVWSPRLRTSAWTFSRKSLFFLLFLFSLCFFCPVFTCPFLLGSQGDLGGSPREPPHALCGHGRQLRHPADPAGRGHLSGKLDAPSGQGSLSFCLSLSCHSREKRLMGNRGPCGL